MKHVNICDTSKPHFQFRHATLQSFRLDLCILHENKQVSLDRAVSRVARLRARGPGKQDSIPGNNNKKLFSRRLILRLVISLNPCDP
jgi:hypothetical protein